MLLFTKEYGEARNAKAKRVRDWMVRNLKVKPFPYPKVSFIEKA